MLSAFQMQFTVTTRVTVGRQTSREQVCWLTNPSVALGRWLSGWLRFCTVSGWVQLSGEFPALTLGTVYRERHWSDFCDFCAVHTDLLFSGGSFTNIRSMRRVCVTAMDVIAEHRPCHSVVVLVPCSRLSPKPSHAHKQASSSDTYPSKT